MKEQLLAAKLSKSPRPPERWRHFCGTKVNVVTEIRLSSLSLLRIEREKKWEEVAGGA